MISNFTPRLADQVVWLPKNFLTQTDQSCLIVIGDEI